MYICHMDMNLNIVFELSMPQRQELCAPNFFFASCYVNQFGTFMFRIMISALSFLLGYE